MKPHVTFSDGRWLVLWRGRVLSRSFLCLSDALGVAKQLCRRVGGEA
ncbi:MAG: hypothetical protein VB141_10875 [Burkholderia gladioli]